MYSIAILLFNIIIYGIDTERFTDLGMLTWLCWFGFMLEPICDIAPRCMPQKKQCSKLTLKS